MCLWVKCSSEKVPLLLPRPQRRSWLLSQEHVVQHTNTRAQQSLKKKSEEAFGLLQHKPHEDGVSGLSTHGAVLWEEPSGCGFEENQVSLPHLQLFPPALVTSWPSLTHPAAPRDDP